MDFDAAVAEVVAATKRPDKIIVARRKVNAAISFFCIDSEFKRDYEETAIVAPVLDVASFQQSIPLSSFEQFRRFHYLKHGGGKTFLKPLSDAEMFKDCCDIRDRYYIAGDNVVINLSCKLTSLEVGWFKYPPILTGADTFWLLDQAPFMIIDYASGEIFREIGEEKSFQACRLSAREAYLSFQKDNRIGS